MSTQKQKTRIAFIKHAGLCIGGSELWLQKVAAHLPKDIFDVDFYYSDDSPYIGASHVIQKSSEERANYLQKHGVHLIKFHVGYKNVTTITNDWVDTDFWEKFDEKKYALVQTVKAGPKEYPFHKITIPVVEIVGLALRPDTGKNIAWSWHSSPWQRAQWVRLGGSIEKSSVLTCPVETPQTTQNYRDLLGIPADHIVAGFHQRADNLIASSIPLDAFAAIQKKHPHQAHRWHFVIKNGAPFYREQAQKLGLQNMHFLPATSDYADVSKFLNTLDIFAHGRKDGETFGAVFIEAMMHGKPCLSHYSADGANAAPETMGPAGIYAKNTEEYAHFLFRLYSDSELRNTLSQKAKPHAETYFSIKQCIDQVLDRYGKILNTHFLTKEISLPIPYYYSDLGFIYATQTLDLKDTNNIAYRALIGGTPRPLAVALFNACISHTSGTFKNIYPDDGLFSWIACTRNITSILCGIDEKKHEDITKTIYLNNWETHIRLSNTPSFDTSSLVRIGTKNNTPHTCNIHTLTGAIIFIDNTEHKQKYIDILQHRNYTIVALDTHQIIPATPSTTLPIIAYTSNTLTPIITSLVKKHRAQYLYWGIIEKERIKQYIHHYIPPYLTPTRVIRYIKRRIKQH